MKPGIISKKSTRIDFQTSKHPLRGAKNEFGPAAFFKLELEKFYFLFSSVQSRTDRNWTLFFIHLEYKMLILIKKLQKFSKNSEFRAKLGNIKGPMEIFVSFELENITV